MADIAHNGAVSHGAHMLKRDDVDIARAGDENIPARRCILHGDDFITFHRGLKRADRVHLCHKDAATCIAQGGG